MPARAVRLVVAALAVALVSCSSTTQGRARIAASGGGAPSAAATLPPEATGPAAPGAAGDEGSEPGRPAAGRERGGPARAGGIEVEGASPPATSLAGGARTGVAPGVRGVTAGEIRIGFQFNDDSSDATFAAVGARGVSTGDVEAGFRALVDAVNAAGGMGGRRVVGVYHAVDNSDGSFDTQAQAACSRFTEDEPVFAVVVNGNASPALPACLAQRGVIVVPTFNVFYDDEQLSAWAPFVYWPAMISGTRLGVWVDGLAAQGYFRDLGRLGLLRYDTPQHARVTGSVVRPALAAQGVGADRIEEVAVSDVSSVAALGGIAAELGNATLRFRSSGVTHVVFVGTLGAVPFLFLPQAESQGYRPRYGFNSFEHPEFIHLNAPVAQFRRALGVGWLPRRDVAAAQDPGDNEASARCVEILRQAGNTPPDRAAQDQVESACEGVFFLDAVLDRAREVGPDGFRAAVDGLGGAYRSPTTFASSFRPGHYDGAAAVRFLAHDDACQCWRYASGDRPAS